MRSLSELLLALVTNAPLSHDERRWLAGLILRLLRHGSARGEDPASKHPDARPPRQKLLLLYQAAVAAGIVHDILTLLVQTRQARAAETGVLLQFVAMAASIGAIVFAIQLATDARGLDTDSA